MAVVITGATGLLGTALQRILREAGQPLRVVSRAPARAQAALGDGVEAFGWDAAGLANACRGAGGVVNLAGANLFARRWTRRRKAQLRESRIDRTRDLVQALAGLAPAERPRVLVSASAVGYYGASDDRELGEEAPAGSDFLATLCRDWEAAAIPAAELGVRVVSPRLGVVLAATGGALAAMRWPFRCFVGGPVLPGNQWVSWVHLDDVVALIRFALDHPTLAGPVNVTAPAPARNREFSKAFGQALRRPSWAPVPGFALRVLLGEVAGVLTTGQRVLPRAATAAGFTFAHPEIGAAMRAVYAR